jgi:hypothetical protein
LLSPNDEFASFEVLSYLLGDPQGQFVTLGGSYVRQALKDGLAMQAAEGYNPFRTGFVGGSDPHNTAVPYRQDDFFGGHPRLGRRGRLWRRPRGARAHGVAGRGGRGPDPTLDVEALRAASARSRPGPRWSRPTRSAPSPPSGASRGSTRCSSDGGRSCQRPLYR